MQTDALQYLSKPLSPVGNIKATVATQRDCQGRFSSARTAGHSNNNINPKLGLWVARQTAK